MGVLGVSFCQAGPPKLLENRELELRENEMQPAAFTEPANLDLSRSITPRHHSETTKEKPRSATQKGTTNLSIWGTAIGFAVVFAVFLAGRVWLTRHGPVAFRGLPVEALEFLGKRTLEPRVSVQIVRCGPKILVLGVSPDGIRTLTEITDPIEIDMIAGACRRKDGNSNLANFSGMFRQTTSSRKSPPLEDA